MGAIGSCGGCKRWRYVVLDAPAHVGAATQAAGKIADLVLVPVTASGVDLVATRAVWS
jgi:cellulose biosynthesis protein BcsQ